MAGKGKEPSFEEALKGLEAVVERLESLGGVDPSL
jgi:exonuclease VII small subunit